MEENEQTQITKTLISDRSIVYNSWEDFWNDMCKDKLSTNVPIRFFWSGDADLDIKMMSVHVALLEKRTIIECIINNIGKKEFKEHVNCYKHTLLNNFDKEFVKTLEDY